MKSKNKMYDVVIVGAGPAGLIAGKILAENKKKVLIIEKNKIAGDKVCAGGLTLKDFEEFNIPKFLIEKEFKDINIHINNRLIKLVLDKPWIWTCSRKELGKWQLAEAKKAGAEIRLNSKVAKIQKDFVVLSTEEKFFFKYLIGADGTNSAVRRFLGLKVKKILLAIQYPVPKGKFKDLEIFFDLERFGPTYAWIFPHKDFDSVGAGIDPRFLKGNQLKHSFDDWCKEIGLNPSMYKIEGAAISYDYQGVEFGNIFLVGDAAGMSSGLTGEGMHPAMVSGKEVARKILDPKYDFKELKEIRKAKRIEEKVLTFYRFNRTITKMMFRLGGLLLENNRFKKKMIKFLTSK